MKKMKHVLTGIVLLLTCVFLFAAQPALADEAQGLNELGNIRNAAQEFADSASRFIIGRQVRMRSSASASEIGRMAAGQGDDECHHPGGVSPFCAPGFCRQLGTG